VATRLFPNYFVISCFLCVVDSNAEMASGLGIAFCGSGLRVASVLLQADVSQQDDIKKCLQRLSPAGSPPRGRSVGLMFACVGRGRHFYSGTVGVESSIFKQLYPHVPLFGFFGNGEIGYDFPPLSVDGVSAWSSGGAGDGAADSVIPQIYHSFTTVFVLLSFHS